MLLSYLTAAFDAPLPTAHCLPSTTPADPHSNLWECRQIAQTFLDLGFAVDVIDWHNKRFTPRRPYRFLLDIGASMERLAPLVGPNCTKILHATGKHWLFQNRAEHERLANLLARRGVVLQPRRQAPGGLGVEAADLLTVLGDEGTLETLRYAGKPCYRIPLSSTVEFPWNEQKDFAAARRRFVWLGSSGMVHKGLDLALEAFCELPELKLTVCGPVDRESDFVACYRRELYETPNIRTLGWTDIAGPAFSELAARCGAIVYPSCSEGCAGSVVACLHAGLVPLVTPESGVEIGDFGTHISAPTVGAVRAAVQDFSRTDPETLRRSSRAAWEFARSHHSRENFSRTFRAVIHGLLNGDDGTTASGNAARTRANSSSVASR